MHTSEIDNILQALGTNVPEASPEPSSSEESSPASPFSNFDIAEILHDNGFSEPSPEDDEEEEENNEEDDNSEDYEEDEESEEEDEETSEEESDTTVPSSESSPDPHLIPQNSLSLLLNESTTRFSGTEWFHEIQKSRILLAGVGGIGSNVAFQLARMVPAGITLYDNDDVEMVNMAGQLFSSNDIGKAKVDAVADMISAYTSMRQVNAIKAEFTADTPPADIMICGFDNMAARRLFFNSWAQHLVDKSPADRAKCLYLDGRLSIDTLQIFCIRGNDDFNIHRYDREFLFSDSEAEAAVCSMKQTTYMACMIGSLMVNLFTNFIADTLNPVIPYDLPFFTEYDAQNMLFKTQR